MSDRLRFEFSTHLAASAAEVWAHATSMRGVNRELFLPVFRMAFALRHRNLRRLFGRA